METIGDKEVSRYFQKKTVTEGNEHFSRNLGVLFGVVLLLFALILMYLAK